MRSARRNNKTRILIIPLIYLLSATLFQNQPVSAFKPNDGGHLGITSKSLTAIERVVDSETLKFSARAIKQIRDANRATDIPFGFASDNHFDNELFDFNTHRLLNLKASVIAKITASSPNGASAREDLGGALHTLQDFYAHTNWVEIGNTSIDTRLGRSTYGGLPLNVATCPTNPATLGGAGLTSLTSGYFKLNTPTGKCRHGSTFFNGLNKDKPGRPNYDAARSLAVEATTDFVNQILDDPQVAGNAKAIKALMDVKSTLGMIIDDTGSMGGIIGQVKTQVAQIINSVRGTEDEPAQYLLVRFGDPDVGPPFATADADAFLSAVNGLTAGGGGDCPELSMTGTLQAVAASQSDARLYLFTDASSKDAALAGNVVAAAKAKRIQISPLLFGSCSPIDPAYIKLAEETGGQLFVLNGSEAGQIFSLVKPQLPGNLAPIMSVRGTLAGDSREFTVPVDSSAESVTFSVSIDSKTSITVLRPSGVPIGPSDPDVSITDLTSGQIMSVSAPTSGTWHVQIAGSGAFSVEALANSPLQFESFQFVTLSGLAEHEGLFPIAGQPLVGTDQTGLASLLGPFASASFELIDQAGQSIQPVTFAQGNPDAAADEFVGSFNLPSQPFRVVVHGLDSNGVPYQRLFSALYLAQSVQLAVDIDTVPEQILSGTTTTLRFIVRNLGAQASYHLVAVDDHGFVSRVQPDSVTLDAGGSSIVEVDLAVPDGTPEGTKVLLTVTGSNVDNAAITNSATLNLSASADATAPVATPTITGTPGTNGWYTSDVTVSWSVSDPESGVVNTTGCEPTTLTAETPGVVLTCSAANGAGLSGAASVTIKIDKTAPLADLLATSGASSRNGWYTGDVTIRAIGADSTANPVVCSPDQFQKVETAGTVFDGACTNNAGLAADAAPLTVKLDKTAPTIAITSPQVRGYANTDIITVAWTASDGLSGVDSSAGIVDGRAVTNGQHVDLFFLPAGSHTLAVTATDVAGNTSSAVVTFTSIAGLDPTRAYYMPIIYSSP